MKKLTVLGGGESGCGAAVLAKAKGMDVFLSDAGKISPKYKEVLEQHGIPFEEGHHSQERILDSDEVVKSPGIPPTAPLIQKIVAKGIPVISEIELAGRYTSAKKVCITGSNGKTTTTLLLYHILREAGLDVGLAGNVGKSMALQVAEDDHEYYVIELSSFQLENMYDFKADIAVIMNITPDHMDRYDHKMENYVAAKFRILQNQTKDDYFIYWEGDPIVTEQIRQIQVEATQMPFSEQRTDDSVSWVDDNGIVHFALPMDVWEIPREKLSLKGLHNLYNSMAAGISATLLKVRAERIKNALEDFSAVEHRLEYVETIDGVKWINDSKATNVNSTWYALESMTAPTVLILGGKDKGNDYDEILPFVREKVKAIVCMGVDNAKLMKFFDGVVPLYDTHSLHEAVEACRQAASEGDTVLLSPCCASFDLFKSYEDRGDKFKAAVRLLKK